MRYSLALVLLFATSLRADNFTNGPKGIRATGFKLPNGSTVNGAGIGIGMIEPGRPGDRDVDSNPDYYHDDVNPFRVFERTVQVVPPGGGSIDLEEGHATSVASIMIGNAPEPRVGGSRNSCRQDQRAEQFGKGIRVGRLLRMFLFTRRD